MPFPIAFPALLPARVLVRPMRAQAMSTSPFSYAQQVYDHGGRAISIDVEMQPMSESDADTFGAFLDELDGMTGTFTFNLDPWTPGTATPYGTKTFRMTTASTPWDSSFGNVWTYRFTAIEVV